MRDANNNTVQGVEEALPVYRTFSNQDKRNWAEKKLFDELETGKNSADKYGWVLQEEVEREFGLA
jgi:hypothetical protein